MSPPRLSRPAAAAGMLAVLGNILGVVVLSDVPSAYRLRALDAWVEEVLAHPTDATLSAAFFTIGLVALAIWALELGRTLRSDSARVGAQVIAMGSLLNAAGTLTPLVLAHHLAGSPDELRPIGRALLGFTLALDASFNLLLSVGLFAMWAAWPKDDRPWLRWIALCAAIFTLPVSGQAIFDPAQRALVFAGPLWLFFIAATSLQGLIPSSAQSRR